MCWVLSLGHIMCLGPDVMCGGPWQGHLAAVARRLDKGDDVEQTDSEGCTALWLASNGGHTAVVQLLLEKGNANVNKAGQKGSTPLCTAAMQDHAPVARVLLEDKADPHQADSDGMTPLCYAAARGHLEIAKALIELGHANPDMQSDHGLTALMFAAANGHLGVVTLLVEEAHANLHLTNDYRGNAALNFALIWQRLPAATLLVAHGAHANLARHQPYTPKREALERGLALHAQVAQYRLDREAQVVGILEAEGCLPADVAQVVWGCEGEVAVSVVIQELGIVVSESCEGEW